MVCCSPVYSSGNHFTPALIADFDQRLPFSTVPERSDVQIVLDSFSEDGRRNIHAGEIEVRPPGAPTSGDGADQTSKPVRVSAWGERHVAKHLATDR